MESQNRYTHADTLTYLFFRMSETVHTLFFSIFGLIPLDKLKIDVPTSNTDNNGEDIAANRYSNE